MASVAPQVCRGVLAGLDIGMVLLRLCGRAVQAELHGGRQRGAVPRRPCREAPRAGRRVWHSHPAGRQAAGDGAGSCAAHPGQGHGAGNGPTCCPAGSADRRSSRSPPANAPRPAPLVPLRQAWGPDLSSSWSSEGEPGSAPWVRSHRARCPRRSVLHRATLDEIDEATSEGAAASGMPAR